MIPAWVERYIGIPYVHAACGHDGADCWGLLVLIWREVYGRDLLPYDGPHWKKGASVVEIGAAITAEVAKYEAIESGAEHPGDGIILRMSGHPLHIGLVVAPGWMIHTHERAGVCLEDYRRTAWSKRVLGFRRHMSPLEAGTVSR